MKAGETASSSNDDEEDEAVLGEKATSIKKSNTTDYTLLGLMIKMKEVKHQISQLVALLHSKPAQTNDVTT